MKALLSWGAVVGPQDHLGSTPLGYACALGHMACVVTLLKAGASFTLPNKTGALPISVAAQNNRMEVIRILLEHGCSPDTASCKKNSNITFIFSLFSSTRRQG